MSASLRIAFALGLAAAAPGIAWARSAAESSSVDLAARAAELGPGEWVWAEEVAPRGPVTVYIDIPSQLATVYRNGVRIAVTTISTGRPSHPTPTGEYTILQKKIEHYSNLYDDAPMPYMQRLGWDGLALHAGELPGYPASHGCIRMPREFAIRLYRLTDVGGTVVIGREPGSVVRTDAVSVPVTDEINEASGGDADALEYEWNPEASPSGPVTIVLSLASEKAVVLRNGIEIGRSDVSFVQDVFFSTHVLRYAPRGDGGADWSFVGVPGNEDEIGRTLNVAAAENVRVPLAFRHALDGVLEPGSTLLITEDALGSDGRRPLVAAVTPSGEAG